MEREELYEAAVRAVLDLCDEAEDTPAQGENLCRTCLQPWENPMVSTVDVRKAIRDALLTDGEETA